MRFGFLALLLVAACNNNGGGTTTSSSATPTTSAMVATPGEVTVGKPPPELTAKAADGTDIKLSSLKGKPVVVYFYPKDETSGCTKEASSIKDAWSDFSKNGVTVIGISNDDEASHKAFAKNHDLPFHLVTDADGSIRKAFGVPAMGRQTFLIGKDGNVKKIYRKVDVNAHAAELLADVNS